MSGSSIHPHLDPQWFVPFFVVLWLGLSALISRTAGWSVLASHFRAAAAVSGEKFRFVSGSLGARRLPVRYGGCLFVVVNQGGFGLSIFLPFRFRSPPLFFPWAQVESVKEERRFFVSYIAVRLRDQWPILSLRGKAGQRIKEGYERRLSNRVL